jgi:hypothetical protein
VPIATLFSSRESKLKAAAYERAADRRGSRVLIRSRTLLTSCQTVVGFFVFQLLLPVMFGFAAFA